MGYFDSEYTGGITTESAQYRSSEKEVWNIDLVVKGIKGIKIRLQVYIENICISHMRKSPCKKLMLEKPENRVDPNQLITNAKIC